jgi:hypothetical protein
MPLIALCDLKWLFCTMLLATEFFKPDAVAAAQSGLNYCEKARTDVSFALALPFS